MNIAVIAPKSIAKVVKKVALEENNSINITCLIYKDFKDVIDIINNNKNKYDGFLFGGVITYEYAKSKIKEENIWEYLPIHESSLTNALFQGLYNGYNISNLSYDTYTKEDLQEIFEIINVDINESSKIHLLENKDNNFEVYNERALEFHRKNYDENNEVCIITALYTVHQKLLEEGINNFISIPTKSVIKDCLENLYLKYISKIKNNSKIVLMFIEISIPNEYSIVNLSEYYFMKEKMKILDVLYSFAEKIQSTVIEFSYNTFLIFSTKNILEAETDNFKHIEIINAIYAKYVQGISIGVGYGKTVSEAKKNASTALTKSKNTGKNMVHVIYEDGHVYVPTLNNRKKSSDKIDSKLIEISEKCSLSIDQLLRIYSIYDNNNKDCFTSNELSQKSNLSIRTVNRILNKLDEKGYLEVVGKRFNEGSGRPRRVIKIKFD